MLGHFLNRTDGYLLRALALSAGIALGGCGSTSTSVGKGTIDVQIGGESLATDGIKFAPGGDPVIADGWDIQFSHVLVTIDKVWLSESPDKVPSDQSQAGDVVAEADGPWAVDLHKPGSAQAAGGEGTAVPITTIVGLNKKGDGPLADGERYAFSYATTVATSKAKIVNFDDDAEAKSLYDEMRTKGYSVYYVGTATWKGSACKTSDDSYDYSKFPTSVVFKIGFATPSSYLNCQNQDNQGTPLTGEMYQRGIPIKANQASVAQMTFHLDHPFFSSVVHDSALYFDQLVAPLVGKPDLTTVTTENLIGMDVQGMKDGAGNALPWRTCDGSDLPKTKQRSFEVGSVPVKPNGDPSQVLRDYRDFLHYVQSTQGHLNGGDGLCFTKRDYSSPL